MTNILYINEDFYRTASSHLTESGDFMTHTTVAERSTDDMPTEIMLQKVLYESEYSMINVSKLVDKPEMLTPDSSAYIGIMSIVAKIYAAVYAATGDTVYDMKIEGLKITGGQHDRIISPDGKLVINYVYEAVKNNQYGANNIELNGIVRFKFKMFIRTPNPALILELCRSLYLMTNGIESKNIVTSKRIFINGNDFRNISALYNDGTAVKYIATAYDAYITTPAAQSVGLPNYYDFADSLTPITSNGKSPATEIINTATKYMTDDSNANTSAKIKDPFNIVLTPKELDDMFFALKAAGAKTDVYARYAAINYTVGMMTNDKYKKTGPTPIQDFIDNNSDDRMKFCVSLKYLTYSSTHAIRIALIGTELTRRKSDEDPNSEMLLRYPAILIIINMDKELMSNGWWSRNALQTVINVYTVICDMFKKVSPKLMISKTIGKSGSELITSNQMTADEISNMAKYIKKNSK